MACWPSCRSVVCCRSIGFYKVWLSFYWAVSRRYCYRSRVGVRGPACGELSAPAELVSPQQLLTTQRVVSHVLPPPHLAFCSVQATPYSNRFWWQKAVQQPYEAGSRAGLVAAAQMLLQFAAACRWHVDSLAACSLCTDDAQDVSMVSIRNDTVHFNLFKNHI